jgi:PAS domain S-box-containing protein
MTTPHATLPNLPPHLPPARKRALSAIWLMLTLVLSLIAGLLAWFSYTDLQQTEDAEYRLLDAHARNTDSQVSGALDDLKVLLARVARDRLVASSGNKSAADRSFDVVLVREHGTIPQMGVLFVTDATGRVLSSSLPSIRGHDLSGDAAFTSQQAAPQPACLYFSRPDNSILGPRAITISWPIVDEARHFQGVVAATIDYAWFAHALQGINPDDSASITVIYNREGDIVYRRFDPDKYFGLNIVDVSAVYREHRVAGAQVTRHVGPSNVDGKTRLFLVRSIGKSGLNVIMSRQRDEVLADWLRNVLVKVLIFVLVAAVMIPLAWLSQRRQRAMLAAKAFTEKLIATASVMLVGLDAAGRVIIFNSAAERVSGYRREEVLGRDWFGMMVPPEAYPQVLQAYQHFRVGGDSAHTFEYPIITRAGRERLISWQNSLIRDQGKNGDGAPTSISFGLDVTERKLAEEEKKRFVAMLSHEFRTPLATIDGAIQHLEMNAANVDEPTHKRYIKIQKAVDRLTKLLDDYLMQDQLDRVSHGLQLAPTSVRDLLEDCQSSALALSTEHTVSIDDGDLPDTVLCDADLMRLVLRILADNAVKYTAAGSHITLRCSAGPNGDVRFDVSDDGAGVASDELPLLFDKFFRGRSAASQSGSGMGLHLARSVVESHGGTLLAINNSEGGAKFTISLPSQM